MSRWCRWWRLVCYGEAFLYGLLHPWQSKAHREAKARDLWQKYGGRIEGPDARHRVKRQ